MSFESSTGDKNLETSAEINASNTTEFISLQPNRGQSFLIFGIISSLIYVLTGVALTFVGFPLKFSLTFSFILGAEVFIALWLGLEIYIFIWNRAFIDSRANFKIALFLILGAVVLGIWKFSGQLNIWLKTALLTAAVVLLSYGVLLFLARLGLKLESSVQGYASGSAVKFLGKLSGGLIATLVFTALLLLDFLGGIFWWYNTYVTPEQRKKVEARLKYLRSIQLTSLYDRHGKYIGLYAKTDSDWSRYYNDPDILNWKISRAIVIAEGKVGEPAWWWRYLPDGEKLKCEPFSIEGFLRMPYYLIRQRRKVGGSPPTLQAAKNFLDFGQKRKKLGILQTVRVKLFEEMPRSYIMCQSFSPRDMMAIYQATLWAGYRNNYGMHRMALYFYGTDELPSLDWNRAVVLASSLPNPGIYNPWYLKNCRLGKCENKRREKVYKSWLKRIKIIKNKVRKRYKVQIPDELPPFKNGLSRLRAVSRRWKNHDLHLRLWIKNDIPPHLKEWKRGSRIQLYYDRQLMTGKEGEPGLAAVLKPFLVKYREQIDDLQISFVLINSKNGQIVAQYGGDGEVDMASSLKPVMGSVFKTITFLAAAPYWPEKLPLLNSGRAGEGRRAFRYHLYPRQRPHRVRNSHKMPPFISLKEALVESANIGFVYLSLRWSWFVPFVQWRKHLAVGLKQMLADKFKYSGERLESEVKSLVDDPKKLKVLLIRHFGYGLFFKNLRKNAAFERAKLSTINYFLNESGAELPPEKLQALAQLLDLDPGESLDSLPSDISEKFEAYREEIAKIFSEGEVTLELLSWNRELRMEIGLRYLIYLAEVIAGMDRKKNHLLPVVTLTLGVNDARTDQLARLALLYAGGKLWDTAFVRRVEKDGRELFLKKPTPRNPPAERKALEKLREAMRGVLEKGTAKIAGNYLKGEFGGTLPPDCGAKTGTVQRSRGVACIGFLGERAGAVTLSTPKNDSLRTYRIRRRLTRELDKYRLEKMRWEKLFEKYREKEPARAARYKKYIEKYEKLIQKEEEKLKKLRELGKRFHKLRKMYKSELKLARKLYYLIRRNNWKIRRVKSKIRFQKRRIRSYEKRISSIEKQLASKDSKYLKKRLDFWKNRLLRSKQYLQKLERRLKLLQKNSSILAKRHRLHKRNYKKYLQEYRKISPKFFRNFEPWNLASSRACQILFHLLVHWKNWEEKFESPPNFDTPQLLSNKYTPLPTLSSEADPLRELDLQLEKLPVPIKTDSQSSDDSDNTDGPSGNRDDSSPPPPLRLPDPFAEPDPKKSEQKERSEPLKLRELRPSLPIIQLKGKGVREKKGPAGAKGQKKGTNPGDGAELKELDLGD